MFLEDWEGGFFGLKKLKIGILRVERGDVENLTFTLTVAEDLDCSGLPVWRVRIGIHSGPVIGAVVGIKKYIYDVFGDTINTASRMETHSGPMHINVSETTCAHTKQAFCFMQRPPIEVKSRGVMRMYFLDRTNKAEAPHCDT